MSVSKHWHCDLCGKSHPQPGRPRNWLRVTIDRCLDPRTIDLCDVCSERMTRVPKLKLDWSDREGFVR